MSAIENLPVVFLLGVGRCGAALFRSLLDWHNQLIILPFSSKLLSLWHDYGCERMRNTDEVANAFINRPKISWMKEKKHSHELTGNPYDFSNVNWDLFVSSFRAYLNSHPLSFQNTFWGINEAYAKASKGNKENARCLIAESLYEDRIKEIINLFPSARFLHVIRDHRGNTSSLKGYFLSTYGSLIYPGRGLRHGRSLFIHILKDYMVDIMRMADRCQRTMTPERYRFVRFEDIKENPEKTMREMAQWIGIDFHPILLEPTAAGKPFVGDSGFTNKKMKGFESEPVNRWKKHLRNYEVKMIEFLFRNSMVSVGYKPVYPQGTASRFIGLFCCFLPWKNEIFYKGFRWMPARTGLKKFILYQIKPFYLVAWNLGMFLISRLQFLFLFLKGEMLVTVTKSQKEAL